MAPRSERRPPWRPPANTTLFLVFRGAGRAMLHAPYLMYFLTENRGLSTTGFGALFSLYYGVTVLCELPSGVLADRLGRKPTLVVSSLLAIAHALVFVLSATVVSYAIAMVLMATSVALASGADSALLYDHLESEGRIDEYARYEGLGSTAWLGTTAIGFTMADWLLVRDGDPLPTFYGTAVLATIALVAALAMREPPRRSTATSREITRQAFRDVARIPGLLRLLIYSVGAFIGLRGAIVLFYNPVLGEAGIGVDRFGQILAAINLVGAVAGWRAAGWIEQFGLRRVFGALSVGLLVMYGLLMLPRIPLSAAIFGIQGIALAIHPIAVRSRLNALVESAERRATLLSVESLTCRLAFAAASVAIGAGLERGIVPAILVLLGLSLASYAVMACLPAGEPMASRRRPASVDTTV